MGLREKKRGGIRVSIGIFIFKVVFYLVLLIKRRGDMRSLFKEKKQLNIGEIIASLWQLFRMVRITYDV